MKRISLPLILTYVAIIGCSNHADHSASALDELADTVRVGQKREVVLTTGTGCWFYDDALGVDSIPGRGFWLLQENFTSDWELTNNAGVSVTSEVEYAVVHPNYCLRRYRNGIEERIECLQGNDALAITYVFDSHQSTRFRMFQDSSFATGNYREKAAYVAFSGVEQRTETDYILPASASWSCVIVLADDSPKATTQAEFLLTNIDSLRSRNRELSEQDLSGFTFHSENKSIENGVAWARLRLAQLYFVRNSEVQLLTGLPDSPYLDGFHASLSTVGLQLLNSPRLYPPALFETMIDHRQSGDEFNSPFSLPQAIYSDSVTYRGLVSTGTAALVFDRVIAECDSFPIGLPSEFDETLDKAVANILNSPRMALGFLTGPGLFGDIGFPPVERRGALFEVQSLFTITRQYLIDHQNAGDIEFSVPVAALEGSTEWRYPYFTAYAVGMDNHQYQIPLAASTMVSLFHNRNGNWFDRLLIPEDNVLANSSPQFMRSTPVDSARSVVPLLSMFWLERADRKKMNRLLTWADDGELITSKGFRSLSPSEAGFQPVHLSSANSSAPELAGDVLVWTAGILADMYITTGRNQQCRDLFDSLSAAIINCGVVGGLAESEESRPAGESFAQRRNPLFSTSLAEYIRILYDDILGIDLTRPTFPKLRLNVPPEWGRIEFNFKVAGATVTIKRLDRDQWVAEQTGSKDPISLEIELWNDPEIRGYGAIKLESDSRINFKIIPTDLGHYTLAWDEQPRE